VPEEIQRQGQRAAGQGRGTRGGGTGGRGGQQADPAQRQAMMERMRGGGAGEGGAPGNAAASLSLDGASNIDALFAPLPRRETPGRVWLWMGGQLKSVRVRLGVTDGQNTELISEELQPDMEVVTGILFGGGSTGLGGQSTGRSNNPLMPQRGRGFGR